MKLLGFGKVPSLPQSNPQDIDARPLRRELFGLSQLEEHARHLAAQHPLILRPGPNRLLQRLSENEGVLREYNISTQNAEVLRRITPAAEWLLDNFYLIEEQFELARRHLPRSYSRSLPLL